MKSPLEHSILDISPTEFELLVKEWIEKTGKELKTLDVKHNQKIEAYDSTYQIDVVAVFEALGSEFKVLIECKKHKSTIPRSLVQELHDKIRSIGAHKGMLFTTTGFQSGAIKYAKAHGIALVTIDEGKASYQTRSIEPTPEPPEWLNLPQFMGWVIGENEEGNITMTALDFRDNNFDDFTNVQL